MPPNELELQGNGKEWSREWNRFPKTAPRIHRSVSFPGVMNLLLFSSHRRTSFLLLHAEKSEGLVAPHRYTDLPRGLKLQLVTGLFVSVRGQ